jgi:hypothetical protein
MNSKTRVVLVFSGVVCLVCILLVLAFRPPVYRSYSAVMIRPFTNAVFGRPFEAQILKSIPAIHKLTVTPGFTNAAALNAWYTNKVVSGPGSPSSAAINIMAVGSSPQDAQNAADDAAAQLGAVLRLQYGMSVDITMRAQGASRWLFINEWELRLKRLFND